MAIAHRVRPVVVTLGYNGVVVQCPGCTTVVSEWAARCPECGAPLDAAPPVAPVRSASRSIGRPGVRTAIVAAGVVVVSIVAVTMTSPDRSQLADDGTTTTTRDSPVVSSQPPSPVPAGPRRGKLAYRDGDGRLAVVDLGQDGPALVDGPVDAYPSRVISVAGSFVVADGGTAWSVTLQDGGLIRQPLGAADAVVASADRALLWVVAGSPAGAEVQLFALDGLARSSRIALPKGARLVANVGALLVLQRPDDRVLELYDLERLTTARFLGVAGEVADGRGSLLAWYSTPGGECDGDCVLHLTDVASGLDRVVEPPPGTGWIRGGAISPDGNRLAAFVAPTTPERPPGQQVATLVIVDVATSEGMQIPGSGVPYGEPVAAATWSVTSGWLFFAGHGGSMRAYFPGASSSVELPAPASYVLAAS